MYHSTIAAEPTSLENEIATVWKRLFNRGPIGPDENFFELGGDSLIAMDLVELLSTRWSIDLPVLDLYQNPSIRELALLVARKCASAGDETA